MRLTKVLAVSALAAAAMTAGAKACEIVHALDFKAEDGGYEISLNGVLVLADATDSQKSGLLSFNDWLVGGENEIAISYAPNGSGEAVFNLVKDCRGAYPEGPPEAVAAFSGGGEKRLSFVSDAPPPQSYDKAAPTDDAGLKEAVKRLADAVAAKDIDAILEMHAPMIADAAADGVTPEDFAGRFGFFVGEGEAEITPVATTTPAFGGAVWQAFNEAKQAPIALKVEKNGARLRFSTGAYWARIDGEWGIVRTN